jgi:YD repeat-containing protein
MSVLTPLAAAALLLAAAVAAQPVTYSYDGAGRLIRADLGGGRAVAYTYDAAGNLLSAASESPDHTLRVAVSPASGGSVAGPGIACPGTCVHAFAGTRPLTLTASPAAGDLRLLAWAGDLQSGDNPFTFMLDADRRLTAYFGAASGSTDTDGVPDVGKSSPCPGGLRGGARR